MEDTKPDQALPPPTAPDASERVLTGFLTVTALAAPATTLIRSLGLSSWLFDLPALRSWGTGHVAMQPNTAIGLILSGIALGLLRSEEAAPRARLLARMCASVVAGLGLFTGLEYLLGRHLGIDQIFLAGSPEGEGIVSPGRMAAGTACNFSLAGVALLLLDNRRVGYRAPQALSALTLISALLALIGYLYSAGPLYQVAYYSSMAIPTAGAFLLLGTGILTARPDRGFMADIVAESGSGIMFRRLLPAALFLPLSLGWLRLQGEILGYYDTRFGLALFAVSNVATLLAVVWLTAKPLQRLERKHQAALEQLREGNRILKVLSECNQILVKAKEVDSLIADVIRVLIEHGGYKYTWVNLLDDGELFQHPSPVGDNMANRLPPSYGVLSGRDCACGEAIRSGQPQIIPETLRNWVCAGCLPESAVQGSGALVSLPLQADGRVLGTLAIYSEKGEGFLSDTQCLLRELADDLAYGIHALRTRDALLENEQRLQAILDSSPAVIYVKDLKGGYRLVNKQFEHIFHLKREEVLGKTDQDVFPTEYADVFRGNDLEVIARRRSIQREEEALVNGETHTYISVKFPLFRRGGTLSAVCGISTDITEHKHLMNQFHQVQKMETVGQLAGGVAHDFNNFLQVIQGYSNFTLDALPPDSREYDNLREIQAAATRAADLTRQLLAFSRKQTLQPRDLDLDSLVDNLVKMLRRLIGEHIDLEIKSARDINSVWADPGQIEQVLMNLCVNARDAMPEGGIITIQMENTELDELFCREHPWTKPGRYVLLSVSDTGVGIPPELREKIFEPFFTTKQEGKGTGLGLATVYGIIKQHEGYIHVYSEVGYGTTIKVYLPSVDRDARGVEAEAVIPVVGGTETILVAEDDPSVREIILRILTSVGYTVLLTEDGEAALRRFETDGDRIHLVLLDVVMPKLSGRAVHDQIKAARPDIPILFCSGYSAGVLSSQFMLSEEAHLIQKPFGPQDLLRKVREVLDGARPGNGQAALSA